MADDNFIDGLIGFILEGLTSGFSKTISKAQKNQKEYLKKCEEQSQKINEYEAKYGVNQKSTEAREKLNKAYEKLNRVSFNNTNKFNDSKKIGDKTVEQWDKMWLPIGPLKCANLTPYNHSVGLYRHKVGGKVMYIGRAIEVDNGGFRKRLSDYRRESDSARKHQSGKIINQFLNEIWTDVLIVGSDSKSVQITKELEVEFIQKYNPEWNVCFK